MKISSHLSLVSFLAVMASGSLLAEDKGIINTPPQLILSGEGNAAFYAFNGSQKQGNSGRGNGTAVGAEDSRLNIEAEGRTNQYGGLIFNYLMGIAGKTNRNTTSVEESRIMIKGTFGRVLIGVHRPVADRMAKGTHSTQVATGGVMGNYTNVINISTGVNKSVDLGGTAKDANKISFISPRVRGFQLGVSFTPSSTRQGDEKLSTRFQPDGKHLPFTKNNLEASLNYIHQMSQDLTWKASLSGLTAKGQQGSNSDLAYRPHDAKSYALGLEILYKDFTWGGEYIDNGKTLANKDVAGQNAGEVYSTGLSYAINKQKTVSVGYLHSNRNLGTAPNSNKSNPKAKANVYNVGLQHKVAPGLTLYAEGTRFLYETDNDWVKAHQKNPQLSSDKDGVSDSRGTVFMVGTKVTF